MPQDLHTLDLRLSVLLFLVEEVAAKQHHVHLLLHPDAELLVEAVKAVHAALRVLLGVTQVNVTRYLDREDYLCPNSSQPPRSSSRFATSVISVNT